MRNRSVKLTFILLIISFFVIGCGGGSKSSPLSNANNATNNSSNSTIGTGRYIDSAVKGIAFKCGAQSGVTDSNGTFKFEKGQDCTFKMGKLLLRKVSAQKLNDKAVIIEDNTTVAQLLQSLDADGNTSNGINISKAAIEVVDESNITLKAPKSINESAIKDLVAKMAKKDPKFKGHFVSKEKAITHLKSTMAAFGGHFVGFADRNGTIRDVRSIHNSIVGKMNGAKPVKLPIKDKNTTKGMYIPPMMGGVKGSRPVNQKNPLFDKNITKPTHIGEVNNTKATGHMGSRGDMRNPIFDKNSSKDMHKSLMIGGTNNARPVRKPIFDKNITKPNHAAETNRTKAPGYMGHRGDMNATAGGFGGMVNKNTLRSTTLEDFDYQPFSKALAIPSLASYTVDKEGYKVFHMDVNKSTTEFFDGILTTTYGINSSILGQTIRIHNGDKVKLVYKNNLSEPTTMHGHGMHVPAIMDGGPANKIQPGASWTAKYTVNQKASTNWYHPHLMGKTAEQVYKGLAGFIIIDDNESDSYNLPKEYGVDDLVLAIQDKRFDKNGQIDYSPSAMETRMGYKADIMMVNGVIEPYVDVPAKKVRLRLLNASNGSVYKLQFSDGREFTQIAVDNSFLEKPVKGLTSVTLTPGERAEIVVDYTNDMDKTMTLVDANSNLPIMQIKVNKDPKTTSTIPEHLTTLVKYSPANAVRERTFVFGMVRGKDGNMHMGINGKLMDMKRVDEQVPIDQIEIWKIVNNMGMTHNFHIHATHFYPISRNGSAANILENEKGYKDVIALPPHSTVKVILKMTDYVTTTKPMPNGAKVAYMYHCHFLEHEDDGMMGQFTVTKKKVVVNAQK